MKIYLIFLTLILTNFAFGQKNLGEIAEPIIEEGFKLYQSEMASWHGTDLFMDSYPMKENVGGYFSYVTDVNAICIFFSRNENPKVIGQITFDKTFNLDNAKIDLNEREFTEDEQDVYELRTKALQLIQTDPFFKTYENTSLNLVPIIEKKQRKVYVLTGPQINGVVIFGNDYLLTFDKKNNLKSKEQLHQNIIPIYFGEHAENGNAEETMHTHLPESSEFMTATDICTLMLYQSQTNWKQHTVVSKNYFSFWKTDIKDLFIVPTETIKKINED